MTSQSHAPGAAPWTPHALPYPPAPPAPPAPWSYEPNPAEFVHQETGGGLLKVFGIVALVFAALNALGHGVSILQGIVAAKSFGSSVRQITEATDAMRGMSEMMQASSALAIREGVVMGLMDVALIIIGVLLLQRNNFGRKLAVAWSAMAFVVLIGRAVHFELFLMPIVTRALTAFTAPGEASTAASLDVAAKMILWTRVSSHGVLGFMAIFPLALLIAMSSRKARECTRPFT